MSTAFEEESLPHSGSHYRSHPSGIEAIEITQYESFLRGNILKYVLRAPYKGSELEDLKKAAEYLQWEIERVIEERFLQRERFRDLFANVKDYTAEEFVNRLKDLDESRNEWDEDYYDYYRAGMVNPCEDCDGKCKVC